MEPTPKKHFHQKQAFLGDSATSAPSCAISITLSATHHQEIVLSQIEFKKLGMPVCHSHQCPVLDISETSRDPSSLPGTMLRSLLCCVVLCGAHLEQLLALRDTLRPHWAFPVTAVHGAGLLAQGELLLLVLPRPKHRSVALQAVTQRHL